jgi:hypothetical protein
MEKYKILSLLSLQEERRACKCGKKIHILKECFGLNIAKTADEL